MARARRRAGVGGGPRGPRTAPSGDAGRRTGRALARPVEAREQVLAAFPHVAFKRGIVRAFADGIAPKPHTAFGNVKADVLERLLPGYVRSNLCDLIVNSPFRE